MRMLLLTAAASLSLAGCQTDKIDTQVKKTLPEICNGYAIYKLGSLVLPAPPSPKAEQARAFLDGVCADPSAETGGSLLIKAAAALITLNATR